MIRWVRDSLPRRRPFLGFSVSSMRRTVFFLVQDRSEERESEERGRRRRWWFGFVPFLWSRLVCYSCELEWSSVTVVTILPLDNNW